MNKFLSIFFIMLFSISFVSAGDFNFNQDEVISNYQNSEITSKQLFDIVGSANNKNYVNRTGDLKLEYFDINNPIYFELQNYVINSTMNITWLFENSDVSTTQELTFNELGTYYFSLSNSYKGENAGILFETQDSNIFQVYSISSGEKEFNTYFGTLISSVQELLNINLNIWYIVYYLFIFVIGLSLVGGLFGVGFKIVNYTKKINNDKSSFYKEEN